MEECVASIIEHMTIYEAFYGNMPPQMGRDVLKQKGQSPACRTVGDLQAPQAARELLPGFGLESFGVRRSSNRGVVVTKTGLRAILN